MMKTSIRILLLLTIVEAQWNIYYTDFVSKNDLYIHCLHYKVLDDIVDYYKEHKMFSSPYQIISYCISREKEDPMMMIEGSIASKLKFVDMKERNINAQDLLSWSAPIDLIERYVDYLQALNTNSAFESYNNCTPLWFGSNCQYTFESDGLFSSIVRSIFLSKEIFQLKWSCYILMKCNRGPPPSCLDWREICDGNVDCLDGIDEIDCLPLEINECQTNEYQCHQGICIPEQFLNDNPYNPDCLDSSDENDYDEELDDNEFDSYFHASTLGTEYPNCFQDPSFRCEDTNHRLKRFVQNSVCSDGQPSIRYLPHKSNKNADYYEDRFLCRNKRVQTLEEALILNRQDSNLTDECWWTMMCLTYILDEGSTDECFELITEINYEGYLLIQSKCNHSIYIIFPEFPVIQGHVRFGYWTNTTYYKYHFGHDLILMPDFICYDFQRCTFLPYTIQINNLTCIEIHRIPVTTMSDLTEFFGTCNYIYETGNETDCIHSSLFHCPGTSKCISKQRLLDANVDCYNATDETYEDSCQLNDEFRFQCSSANRCVAASAVRDGIPSCPNYEDELSNNKQIINYQMLCNSYTNILPDEENETDETNCEQWPCNNQYTRCDGAWTCLDGADEINCNPNSTCYDSHECVSPTDFQIVCLPLNRTNDGIVDCLGATDERKFCRDMHPLQPIERYRCLNELRCRNWIGNPGLMLNLDTVGCRYEENFIFNRDYPDNVPIQNSSLVLNMLSVLNSLLNDKILIDNDRLNQIHFHLGYLDNHLLPSNQMYLDEIEFRNNSYCNRGILIQTGLEKIDQCLCPPSYYGNQCQLQNQRVSLTVQFSKECDPECRGIYSIILILIDSNEMIHSYEQITYIPTKDCDRKYNFNLLYQSRPKDLTKNYSIQIDIYNRVDLRYYSSLRIPIPFLFLPVNRISTQVIIPSHPMSHGNIGGSDCNCSSSAICLGMVNHRSICLCSLDRSGPRCFLPSACNPNPCNNHGQCIPEDDRWSRNRFICLCPEGYFGETCHEKNMRIEISFDDVEIPQALLIYFVTVQANADPVITTISKKIALDQDTITLHTLIVYNMIFVQFQSRHYLPFIQVKAVHKSKNAIKIKSSYLCPSIDGLLDQRIANFSFLRRIKYYHVVCKDNLQLSCFHDSESLMCLCNKDRYANCFAFPFDKPSTCLGRTRCENDGHCIPDLPTCPTSSMCVCPECYYGAKCQFTTKGSSLSLDIILGYHIRQHMPIYRQPISVKVSITVTTVLMVIGLVSNTFSTLIFRTKSLREVGCGLYLYFLSIIAILTTIVFTWKLWLLILFQTLSISNLTFRKINCISIDFILQSLVTIENWLSVCVSIERVILMKQSNNLRKKKSVIIARWMIIGIILITFVSYIHDPLYHRLIDDDEEHRRWCIIQYLSLSKTVDSIIRIIHFVIPFVLNLICALIIIITVARVRSNIQKKKEYKEHLREQLNEHKHLIISPIILLLLALPRLIISFLSGCIKSLRNPWLFIFGYYISFIPPILSSIIFVLPSKTYRKELKPILQRIFKK